MAQLFESQRMLAIISTVFTLITAIAAVASAVAAWRAAKATREAAEATRKASEATRLDTHAQLLSSLLDAYGSEEMLDAISKLQGWVDKEHGEHFADVFRRQRREDTDEVEEINRARRRMAHYYEKVCALWKTGLIDETVVREAASKGQVEFLRKVVEPLDAALNPGYDHSCFDRLADLYGEPRHLLPMANPKERE